MNVFCDTNVILDVLLRRDPFYADSAAVLALAEAGSITGFVSTVTYTNVHYVVRRLSGREAALGAVKGLRAIVHAVPFDERILDEAADSGLSDFEDAVQFFSARRVEAAAIVTRNTADFPVGDLAIQTPTHFLAAHFPNI